MPGNEEAPGAHKGARGSDALLGGDVQSELSLGDAPPQGGCRRILLRSIHDEAGRWQGLEVAHV